MSLEPWTYWVQIGPNGQKLNKNLRTETSEPPNEKRLGYGSFEVWGKKIRVLPHWTKEKKK